MTDFKRWLRDHVGPYAVAPLVRAWFQTIRLEVHLPESLRQQPIKQQRLVLCSWHDSMIPLIRWLAPSRVHMLASLSHDGELIARICQQLGARLVRGSSTRGGKEAVCEITQAASAFHNFQVGVTVDGPRGPRHVAKPGVLVIGQRIGAPVIPLGIAISREWRTRSWDRLRIPFPFSRIVIASAGPIEVPSQTSEREMDELTRHLTEQITASERLAQSLLGKTAKALPNSTAAQAA